MNAATERILKLIHEMEWLARKNCCWMNQTEVWVNGVGLAKMNESCECIKL